MLELFPKYAEMKISLEAINTAQRQGISQTEAEERLTKVFNSYGPFKFSFDSATTPAVKQMRYKLLLAKLGALNLLIDEVGFHLESNYDVLTTFLELFDKGLIKDKLTKNTQENQRSDDLTGSTASNLLMFGTPSKLLDGGKTEDLFFELLESGYARRSFFSMASPNINIENANPEELYDSLSNQNRDKEIKLLAKRFLKYANVQLVNTVIEVPKATGIALIKYRINCEKRASKLPEHLEILKAELTHRYFKALKLAGAYAFLEGNLEVTEEHLNWAIKFTEDSGEALELMLHREKPYERLAKYIGSLSGKELTQVDLHSNLPFYRGTKAARDEMMIMATAYGYKNNILIKRQIRDGIEFFTGESLEETNLSNIICAYSESFGDGYINAEIDWHTDFDTLLPTMNYNWTNHHSIDGSRKESNMLEGFNCVVLDVDKGTTLNNVMSLLSDYEYIIHTTKRHQKTDEQGNCNDRFRIILPTNYIMKLDKDEFKKFMENIAKWFPFELDEQTFQRSRKWSCYENAVIYHNQGKLLDVLPFIPRTSRENEFNDNQGKLSNLDNLERWFATKMQEGNRNNNFIKYALMLLDNGFKPMDIRDKLIEFNKKLPNKLDESEIDSTIMVTVQNKYGELNE